MILSDMSEVHQALEVKAVTLHSKITSRVPQTGETIEHPRGLIIEILEADPRRVVRAKLRGPRPAPSALAEDKSAAVER